MILPEGMDINTKKNNKRTLKVITNLLKEPFDKSVIHWRVGATSKDKTKGIALAYINSRDAAKRFDDVCGDMWQVEYPFEGCCKIGLKVGGEWLWRSNGAGETAIEGEKGQYSDAFKRAATMWGVGRYLYYLPNVWVDLDQHKKITTPPNLPDWALPNSKRGKYSQVLNAHIDALRVLQDGIQGREDTGKLYDGIQAWLDIPEEDQKVIYGVSPSSNGLLTTEQRTYMLSSEFANATKIVMGL